MGKKAAVVPEYAATTGNVRCHAHKKNGERCRRWALKGAKTCTSHGSGTQAARKRAAEVMAALAPTAATRIGELIEDPKAPHAVQLSAAKFVMQANGINETHKLEVEVGLAPWESIASRIFVDAQALEVYEDAVIVDDDSDLPPGSV